MKKEPAKRSYGNDQKRRNISIDDGRKTYLESLSLSGNMSEGIRSACDFHKKNSKGKKK